MNNSEPEIPLSEPMRRAWLDSDERSIVYRKGDVVLRETGPWAKSVHAFLRHLESVGFDGAPKIVGSGFADDGRETLSFVQGEVINPKPFDVEGVEALGRMIRSLHDASASFEIEDDSLWPPFFGRDLGGPDRIISHCDVAPWNVVSVDGLPAGLIDWEYAGMNDPMYDLAGIGYTLDGDGRDLLLEAYFGSVTPETRHHLETLIPVFLCWNVVWSLIQIDGGISGFDYFSYSEGLLDWMPVLQG